ncbi:hypothetical protein EJB05_14766 [Eragrostis curvula]|uniref:FBD domain-containing protein n=1 Tax=Eragrostis curvula TaxID=38414 RepID=A0A5J9W010_9POAL|nr:hypothetical protein EJB05_14766 [Eragrostis curvula]
MYMEKIHFRGPEILGDVLSSARCPSLQWIGVLRARGLSNLTIHSKTLLGITLHHLEGFQQLTIVSRKLKKLDIVNIFEKRQPLANVTAPVLEVIRWFDNYDPFSVQLGELAQVQELRSLGILGHGFPSLPYNRDPLRLLCRFQKIPILYLHITYPIGKAACSPSCQCHQLQDLETEELSMNSLQEVEISQCRGGYYEHAFLKRVIRWAPALKKVIVTFDPSVTVVTEELCQELLRLPGPEICMRIYLYRDGEKVIYAPAA